MPRKGHIAKRETAPDPVYSSTLVTKFGDQEEGRCSPHGGSEQGFRALSVVRSIVIPNVVRDPYCDQMHGFIRDSSLRSE